MPVTQIYKSCFTLLGKKNVETIDLLLNECETKLNETQNELVTLDTTQGKFSVCNYLVNDTINYMFYLHNLYVYLLMSILVLQKSWRRLKETWHKHKINYKN